MFATPGGTYKGPGPVPGRREVAESDNSKAEPMSTQRHGRQIRTAKSRGRGRAGRSRPDMSGRDQMHVQDEVRVMFAPEWHHPGRRIMA